MLTPNEYRDEYRAILDARRALEALTAALVDRVWADTRQEEEEEAEEAIMGEVLRDLTAARALRLGRTD